MVTGAPYALILAAGQATRFGGDKLLATLRGQPLIAHVAGTVAAAVAADLLGGAVAVVPPGATELGRQLELTGISQVENPAPEAGLAGSIQLGLTALESVARPAAQAALIVLADQPLLSGDVIRRLVAAWRRSGKSVRPRYAGSPHVPGHPVLLDRSLWASAQRLAGDHGLGPMLAERPEWCEILDLPGSSPDIDTPSDLTAIEESPG